MRKLILAGVFTSACAATGQSAPTLDPTRRVTTVLGNGIQITAIRTGYVRVRPTHRELTGPLALALPRILLETGWSEWMPVLVYLIRDGDRLILVDTGLDAAHARDYEGLDWFYRNNLGFFLPEAEALSVQLEELGIRPADVDTVLLTHLHADHTGNVGLFTEARFVTGENNWPSHVGSVLNADIHPTLISDGEIGAIEPLSERTAVVLLPGHTHGHLGLQLSVGGTTHVFVGDATFDPSQTHRGAISGVSEDGARARATQRYLRNQTHLWPAHDPSVFERLPVSVGP